MSNKEMTKGQERRYAKKQAALAAKRKKKMNTIIGIAVGIAILAVIAIIVVVQVSKAAYRLNEVTNFSEGLTEDGRIKNGNSASNVTTIDPNGFSVAYSEIEASEDDIQKEIDELLDSEKYDSEDTSVEIKDGDTINLDYVGTVDGVEFAGGNTNGNGTSLTIGSGSYIDNFEEQLIGHKPGEEVTVNVTFPDPYDNNPDLAGKAAVFACKINSVEVTPELTDEFIAEALAETEPEIKTVDQYRAHVKEELEEANLKAYIQKTVSENSVASKIPSSYTKIVKNIIYTNDLQMFNYYNNMYSQYLGAPMYNTFNDYTQMTDKEYSEATGETAKKAIAAQMAYEVLFDKLNLSITDQDYTDYCAKIGTGVEETYGKGYIMMNIIGEKVVDKLAETAIINK